MKHCFQSPDCAQEIIDAAPGGDPDYAAMQEPITVEGRLFVPADDLRFISHSNNNQAPKFAALCLSIGPMGIACHMTPATIRRLAANMLASADAIDDSNAEAAAAALKKAGGA